MDSEAPPFFSIVTVTLNDLAGVRRTHASVDTQSMDDFEWIVIDGGSTDGTPVELNSYRRPNFRYISEKDRGLYHAMNKGLALSRGQYVIFMNSGDCFADAALLEDVKRSIQDSGQTPAIVYGDALEEAAGSERVTKKARPIQWLHYGMPSHHQAFFYLRQAISGPGFDESFKVAADYDLTCRIFREHGTSLLLDRPVCIFLRGGLSERKPHIGRGENWRIQQKVLGHRLGRRLLNQAAYLASSLMRTNFNRIYSWARFQNQPAQAGPR